MLKYAVAGLLALTAQALTAAGFEPTPKGTTKAPRTPWTLAQTGNPVGPCGGTCRLPNGRTFDCPRDRAPVFTSNSCFCEYQPRCR
jgi:hypothetical protein